jgi:hypothetical protein
VVRKVKKGDIFRADKGTSVKWGSPTGGKGLSSRCLQVLQSLTPVLCSLLRDPASRWSRPRPLLQPVKETRYPQEVIQRPRFRLKSCILLARVAECNSEFCVRGRSEPCSHSKRK